ncbi:efflux RND transporter permease subunit [Methylotenera sp. G11]|uniref:efflux RND transporter permease subunit n=1 Tax=Methylotenera sp. G11 TaxID=1506585 RepID=UPI000646BE77|nr:CusA/CzcA family heavy metal efflux RND transporter [Methylotenera sp. G11]
MINRIVRFALTQPVFVVLGLVLFVLGGVIAFINLPIEAFPDVSDTQVNIVAQYPGRAAEEVEKQVTIPIEVAMSGMPNMVRMFTHTQFGLSYMMITFNDKPSDKEARQQVFERLRGIDLPDGVEPDVAPLATSIGEIYRYRVQGDHLNSRQLREIEEWVVEKALKKVPGVANVVSMGGALKQYEVNPDLAKMRDAKITLAQLFSALTRANANAGGGAISQGRQQFLVRSLGTFTTSADIDRVVVGDNGKGVPILVRDIAEVKEASAPVQGLVGQDDSDDIVNGLVLMRKGENPSELLKGIKQTISELNDHGLPPGVQLRPYYDRSWLIDKTLHTVFGNLIEGALLVTFVLLLFLGNLRAALIVACIIPLAVLSTFIGLTFLHLPANLLSLGAMDFGIIVDGAVIVVENVFLRLGNMSDEAQHNFSERRKVIYKAVTEVGRPTLFSMLVIIAAHIPIFTLQRAEGRIFSPMAFSVTSALVGSLMLSLTLVPLLCLWLLRDRIPHHDNRLLTWFKHLYEPAFKWAVARPKKVLGIALILLVAALGLGTKVGTEFLPELDEGTIWVNVTLPPSISQSEALLAAHRIRAALHSVPEVKSVISKVGRPDDGSDPKIFNGGEFFVELAPEETWRKDHKKAQIIDEMDKAVSNLPGVDATFSQPIRDNVLESISQIDGQIVIKVHGDDLSVLRNTARSIVNQIHNVQGVSRAYIDRDGDLPQQIIDIDRDAAARYGINIADIQDAIETALAGKATTELWEGERHFSVVVRLAQEQRSLSKLDDLLIAAPNGAQIPLHELAHFKQTMGAMNIARENGQRVVSIGIFIQDRDMGSVVADMQKKVNANVSVPNGAYVTWSGEFENQQRAMARLSVVVPLSILLIFVLLFDAFGSFKNALLIVANIPFALIGGIVALFITGIPLSVSAAIGFIALFGQAVLNGVVMVSVFDQLIAEGKTPEEAVHEGSMSRLRTVLMTGLLAMFGLLPMALSHNIGAETQRPLAVVVIGGLISATLLTLLVLPSVYLWVVRKYGSPANAEQEKAIVLD